MAVSDAAHEDGTRFTAALDYGALKLSLKHSRIYARIDFAVGDESDGVHVSIGEVLGGRYFTGSTAMATASVYVIST